MSVINKKKKNRMHFLERKRLNEFSAIETVTLNKAPLTLSLEDERAKDVGLVGGKAASLAELRSIPGVNVPEAFVLTTSLYDSILQQNSDITKEIIDLDNASSNWLKARLINNQDDIELFEEKVQFTGKKVRKMITDLQLGDSAYDEITRSYSELCRTIGENDASVAVRSSGVGEDGAKNSFAGQNKTLLHQKGVKEVNFAIMECIASQFAERAIVYRNESRAMIAQKAMVGDSLDLESAISMSQTFSHRDAKIAVVVQRMVDAQSAGVGFSVDPKTGANITRIEVSYGLGEAVVGGMVTPDSYDVDPKTEQIIGRNLGEKETKVVYAKRGTKEKKISKEDRKKFAISDIQVKEIASKMSLIKKSYGTDVGDMEFAIDENGKLYFLQARPETVASQEDPMIIKMKTNAVDEEAAKNAKVILKGGKTGSPGAAVGIVEIVNTIEEAKKKIAEHKKKGEKIILVTKRTDPDWVPIMKEVSGIITETGGTTAHAAIVSRELGIPCIIGVGKDIKSLTKYIGKKVTIDAAAETVYEGELPLIEVGEDIDVRELLKNLTKTKLGLNIANIDAARKMHALAELGDNFKISLLRTEFLLKDIGVHVNALIDFDKGKLSPKLHKQIVEKISGYKSGEEYFKTKLSENIAAFGALFPNSEITLRTTDFKTNEYMSLIGGKEYEPVEANPMMGDRGVGRYIHPENEEAFIWELEAIKRARDMGYKNIQVMFPMVRDVEDLKDAHKIMAKAGLKKGEDGLKVGMMVEIPQNMLMMDEFAEFVDFFSIGSNDLTQFILAVDRDSEKLAGLPRYSEDNPAVIKAIKGIIKKAKELGKDIGICGQAPSKNPAFARMLVEEGINSIGVTPDRFLPTHNLVRVAEAKEGKQKTIVEF